MAKYFLGSVGGLPRKRASDLRFQLGSTVDKDIVDCNQEEDLSDSGCPWFLHGILDDIPLRIRATVGNRI